MYPWHSTHAYRNDTGEKKNQARHGTEDQSISRPGHKTSQYQGRLNNWARMSVAGNDEILDKEKKRIKLKNW